MAEFKKIERQKEDEEKKAPIVKAKQATIALNRESRCKVCTSPHVNIIDQLIARGISRSEVARMFPDLTKSSVNRHANNHLNYESAAILKIVEEEAQAQGVAIEEGVNNAVKRRAYIDAVVEKGFEKILDGTAEIEVRDVATLIQLKEKMDSNINGAAVDQIRAQFTAIQQAIKELVSEELWDQILIRSQEIYGQAEAGLPSAE